MARKLRRDRLTFANVVSVIALLFALGLGTAFAAEKIGSRDIAEQGVKSRNLKNTGVKGKDLANGSVSSPKVANGSLLSKDFAPNQLQQGDTGPQGEPGPQGDPGSQGQQGPPGANGANGVSGYDFVSSGTVIYLDVAANTVVPVEEECPSGTKAVGGGVDFSATDAAEVERFQLTRSSRDNFDDRIWRGSIRNTDDVAAHDLSAEISVICVTALP